MLWFWGGTVQGEKGATSVPGYPYHRTASPGLSAQADNPGLQGATPLGVDARFERLLCHREMRMGLAETGDRLEQRLTIRWLEAARGAPDFDEGVLAGFRLEVPHDGFDR